MKFTNILILSSVYPAVLLSLVGTALVRFVAVKRGWFDDPSDPRKIHIGNIPRLGGVGMFWAFTLTLGCVALILRGGDFGTVSFAPPLIVAFATCHFTGLYDDFRNLRARWKLLLQSLAAIILVLAGFRFRTISLPGLSLDLGYISYPISFLWIVGVTNAINMIDGMDGLAGGLVAIAAFTYGIIYTSVGNSAAAITSFVLAGSILGFLFHNYPPAKIFMGDSGSLFLGISIAALPLLGRGVHAEASGIFIGITVVLIPVLDVAAAIMRRLRRGVSVMSPDKEHLHHKIMSLGVESRTVLLILYAFDLLFCCLILSGLILPYRIFFGLLVVSWFIAVLGFLLLHFATNPDKRLDDYMAKKDPGTH